ncbi:MAG: hypothetical protein KF830_12750 [Planctomycetes bacterium]|nr:hypothetical protein [Planctomycetota bacterium]
MRSPIPLLRTALLAASLGGAATAQEPKAVAYPERDALTPFRQPADVYAPPDRLFALLRTMQAIADRPDAPKDFDADGREVVDDPAWRQARAEVGQLGVDAAYLAQIMRLHRNAGERATAFYGAFHCDDVDHVLNLIAHIPGEPERRTRQAALPRAVAFLRAHLGRRFGDLGEEQRRALRAALPEPGSPAARARGITRAPLDQDHLHELRLVPFFQLLDLDEPIDQAQGLWFLKEVFLVRPDLALLWVEPALPRLRQLLAADDEAVRAQAIGLFAAIGPRDLGPAPAGDPRALQEWADRAAKFLFPPIRNLNDAIVQLQPSPERDALAAAGVRALEGSAIGDPFAGKGPDGRPCRGFRIAVVPDELKPLAIPAGAVITTVNGVPVTDAASLLRTVREQLRSLKHPRQLVVEYLRGGAVHAIEYRLL